VSDGERRVVVARRDVSDRSFGLAASFRSVTVGAGCVRRFRPGVGGPRTSGMWPRRSSKWLRRSSKCLRRFSKCFRKRVSFASPLRTVGGIGGQPPPDRFGKDWARVRRAGVWGRLRPHRNCCPRSVPAPRGVERLGGGERRGWGPTAI